MEACYKDLVIWDNNTNKKVQNKRRIVASLLQNILKLRKNTLKKLIKDCCKKNVFSFNGIIRKQKDGVPMGSSLVPTLANIIMMELERVIVEPLITSGKI